MDLKILSGQTINSQEELKSILKFLENQGFGYISEWGIHQKKIDDIIHNANTLGIKYDDEFKRKLYYVKDYKIAEQEAIDFFSKFNPSDKINELMRTFYIIEDDNSKPPSYTYPDTKDVIEWVNFRLKYNLKDEFPGGDWVKYYNLDKNYLKINYGDDYDFRKLYKLLYNEECPDFSSKKLSEWITVGKIEIKYFANGNVNIKGSIQPFREYYYNYIKEKRYNQNIIKYNGNVEIYKSKRQ